MSLSEHLDQLANKQTNLIFFLLRIFSDGSSSKSSSTMSSSESSSGRCFCKVSSFRFRALFVVNFRFVTSGSTFLESRFRFPVSGSSSSSSTLGIGTIFDVSGDSVDWVESISVLISRPTRFGWPFLEKIEELLLIKLNLTYFLSSIFNSMERNIHINT